jgi:hypothetical protein
LPSGSEAEHQRRRVPVQQLADGQALAGEELVRRAGIGRQQADAGVDPGRQLVAGGDEGESRSLTPGERELHPPEAGLQLLVDRRGEADVLEQGLGPVLVGHRNGHGLELREEVGHASADSTFRWDSSVTIPPTVAT